MKSIVKLFVFILFLLSLFGCKRDKQVTFFYPTTNTIKVHTESNSIVVYSYGDNAIDTILELHKNSGNYYGEVLDVYPELILSTKHMMDTTYTSPNAVFHRILIRKEVNGIYSSTIFSLTNNILIKLEYDEFYKIRKICRFGYSIDYIHK